MGRKHVPVSNDPYEIILDELGLDAGDWRIRESFAKSVFRGKQRHVGVEVTHVPSGKSREAWQPARSKRHARALAVQIAIELLVAMASPST